MVIVETSVFSRQVQKLLSDEGYRHLQAELLMLLIYPKNVQDDLTPAQLKALKQVVEAEFP